MPRLALVTGGTRGIGAAVAKSLMAADCRVAAVYHGNDEAANAFAAETGIRVYKWDVSSFSACHEGVAHVVRDAGSHVEVLVNNAGITHDAVLHRMTEAQWTEVIATDLGSCFNMCRAVIEPMRRHGFGRIINISSINGQKGQLGQTNYAAAKAGILGFTKALALESAGKGITVNAVAPGYILTDMVAAVPEDVRAGIVAQIPVGHLGSVADIARVLTFLASDDAGFITGATITANGGQYMT